MQCQRWQIIILINFIQKLWESISYWLKIEIWMNYFKHNSLPSAHIKRVLITWHTYGKLEISLRYHNGPNHLFVIRSG